MTGKVEAPVSAYLKSQVPRQSVVNVQQSTCSEQFLGHKTKKVGV